MIHYHGTPFGGSRVDAQRFIANRHVFIPWQRNEDIQVAGDCAASFAIDNSAFTFWQQGQEPDWESFYEWLTLWINHPALDWVVIPDVIDGTELENDRLTEQWPFGRKGIPVWHLHESLERLEMLVAEYDRVGLGSSGNYSTIGTNSWWKRMGEAMSKCCDKHGRPLVKLHGFRMLDPNIFTRFPFASADSTNVARNASITDRFGMYCPPLRSQRAEAIAQRIESVQSPAIWTRSALDLQQTLF